MLFQLRRRVQRPLPRLGVFLSSGAAQHLIDEMFDTKGWKKWEETNIKGAIHKKNSMPRRQTNGRCEGLTKTLARGNFVTPF